MNEKKHSLRADLSLVLVAVIWGSGFIATQYAIDSSMSTGLIMTLRFSIATLVLLAVFGKKLIKSDWSHLAKGMLTGLWLFLGFYFQTLGLRYTTPSNNAFITSTNVVIVPLLCWVVLKKPPRVLAFISSFICLVGIGILNYKSGEDIAFLNLGDTLTLICAFFFACHISYLGVSSKLMDFRILAFIQMATATILSSASMLLFEWGTLGEADFPQGLLPVMYLGIFSTCVGFLIQTSAQRHTTATRTAVILVTEALFGGLFSVLLKVEPMTINLLVGGTMILSAAILCELPSKKLKKL